LADYVETYTGKVLKEIEKRLIETYKEAQRDILQKMAEFEKKHRAKNALMQQKLKAGEITQEQYRTWMQGQVFIGKQWEEKKKSIEKILLDADRQAAKIINEKSLDVFAESANWSAYEIEKELGGAVNFGLYNTRTVSKLIEEQPELLPRRVINGVKADAWNAKKIANAISQGIIQGEGIPEISKRIARDTGISAGKSSTLYARTAMTGAQNAGRQERMLETEEQGIEVKKMWIATLDDRTRDAHSEMDGQTVDVDAPFHSREFGDIMFPGDPSAEPGNLYNCRCAMKHVFPKYQKLGKRERIAYYTDENGNRKSYKVGDVTYKEWQKIKEQTKPRQVK
jgi:SPP1 gp7 family putative phage head morphogenesis protein